MDIGATAVALGAGQKVARDEWYEPQTPSGSIFVFSVLGFLFHRNQKGHVTVWSPRGEDILADDWEIIS